MKQSIFSMFYMLSIRVFAILISFFNIFLIKQNFPDGSVLVYQTCLSVIVFLSVFSLFGAESYIVNRFGSSVREELFSTLSSTVKSSVLLCVVMAFGVTYFLYDDLFLSLVVSLLSVLLLVTILDASIARAKKKFLAFQVLRSLPMQASIFIGVVSSLYFIDFIQIQAVFFVALLSVGLLVKLNQLMSSDSVFNIINIFGERWRLVDICRNERMSYFFIATYASFIMLFDVVLCGVLFPESDDYVVASRFAQVLMVFFVVINNYYSSIFRQLYLNKDYEGLKYKFIESVVISAVFGVFLLIVVWFVSLYVAELYFEVGETFLRVFVLLLVAYSINLLLSVPISLLLMIDRVVVALAISLVSAVSLVIFCVFQDFDEVDDVAMFVVFAFGTYKLLAFGFAVYELNKTMVSK